MKKSDREAALATLLAEALAMLPENEEAEALKNRARDLLITLVRTPWTPDDAPPGIPEVQAELREVANEEAKRQRNRRKAGRPRVGKSRPN